MHNIVQYYAKIHMQVKKLQWSFDDQILCSRWNQNSMQRKENERSEN